MGFFENFENYGKVFKHCCIFFFKFLQEKFLLKIRINQNVCERILAENICIKFHGNVLKTARFCCFGCQNKGPPFTLFTGISAFSLLPFFVIFESFKKCSKSIF